MGLERPGVYNYIVVRLRDAEMDWIIHALSDATRRDIIRSSEV